MASITITGLEPLFRKLSLAAAIKTLEPPMQRSVFRLEAAMKVYPPAPAQSKYVRTGTYGRRWFTKVASSQSGLVGKIGTNVDYAPWVGSAMFQARIHARTGWITDLRAITQSEKTIVADFQGAIDRALAS